MFDWDADYEGVVQSRVIAIQGNGDHKPARPSRHRLIAGVVALALALGTGAAVLVTLPAGPSIPGLAAMVRWPAQTPALPAGLHAYDHSQFLNFHRGIARFSDAELLSYARETERSLTGDNPMAAFTRDALFLAQREIDRRGLRRPLGSLRAAFGAS